MIELNVIRTRIEDRVLVATLDAPPLNLIGPDIVGDLVRLVHYLEAHEEQISVVVFDSANPDFFSAHVDMVNLPALAKELGHLSPGASLWTLYRRISTLNQVTIASIAGRVRGAGSEFILSCDMRFASAERGVFGQPEVGVGAIPGAGAAQLLTRLMGRGRALEVLLGADDFPADLAERYGWINRALPDADLATFVNTLAHRISRFPLTGLADTKTQVNDITLPQPDALITDSQLFLQAVARPDAQVRLAALFEKGMQTNGMLEADFGAALAELSPAPS